MTNHHVTKLLTANTSLPVDGLKDFIKQDNAVLCLLAPTASGKTDFAHQLYQTGRFELISVDSALIYQDMNIGSAKPTADELMRYPHHLVDIMPPTDSYGVASFVADVQRLIEQIHQRGKLPFLVGGTMMYYMALFDGISAVPDSEPEVRTKVAQWLKTEGLANLYTYLQTIDPITAHRLNATDSQRITRAIEVYEQTNKPISHWQQLPKMALAKQPNQAWLGLAVMPERAWLYERIQRRLEQMWQQGLIFEVVRLIQKYPLHSNLPSMRCVGYRQAIDGLMQLGLIWTDTQGKLSVASDIMTQLMPIQWLLTHLPTDQHLSEHDLSELLKHHQTHFKGLPNMSNPPCITADDVLACQDIKNKALYATRQLAKRQYTWLNKLIMSSDAMSVHDGIKTIMTFTSIEQIQQKLC